MSPDNEDNQLSNRPNFDKAGEDKAEPEKLSLSNQQDVAEEDSKSHVCKICHQSFYSGKALGGHISMVHVQGGGRRSKVSNRKLKSKTRRNGSGDSGDHKCEILGKGFQSEKSLYGHMRSHSKKPCRKMDSLEESYQDQDDDGFDLYSESSGPGGISYDNGICNGEEKGVLDLGTFLERSWHKTKQRTERSLTEKTRLACQILKGLASGSDSGPGSCSDKAKGKKPVIESTVQKNSTNDKAIGKKLKIDEERTVQKSNKRRSLDAEYIVAASPTKKSEPSDKAKGKKPMIESTVHKYSSNDKVKGKKKMINEERTVQKSSIRCSLDTLLASSPTKKTKSKKAIEPSSPGVHDICNKKFETYQALGGHQGSHFRHRVTTENAIDGGGTFSRSSMPRANSAEARRDRKKYICDVSNRSFPSGQALGVHKKRHVTAAAADQTHPPSQSTSTAESSIQVEQCRPLDIDLNESHVTAASADLTPPSQSTSTEEGSSQVEQRRPLDFDLNESHEIPAAADQPPLSQSTSTAEGRSSQVEQRRPLDFDLNEMPDNETGGDQTSS